MKIVQKYIQDIGLYRKKEKHYSIHSCSTIMSMSANKTCRKFRKTCTTVAALISILLQRPISLQVSSFIAAPYCMLACCNLFYVLSLIVVLIGFKTRQCSFPSFPLLPFPVYSPSVIPSFLFLALSCLPFPSFIPEGPQSIP